MPAKTSSSLVWWAVPGVIGGMPMPWLHPDRRDELGGELSAWDDELPQLYKEGVRAVVCLLNIPGDPEVYRKAGFAFLLMPVANGGVPGESQTLEFLDFVSNQVSAGNPVAVHCEAGLGRTGTVIAAWLIASGASPEEAIERVRELRPGAIETAAQVNYLLKLPAMVSQKNRGIGERGNG